MATLDPSSNARSGLFRQCCCALVALTLFACSDHQGDHGSGSSHDAECSGDFDAYQAGMSKQAEPGKLTVQLLESDPAPPEVRTDNTWWLRLSDAEGEPLREAELLVTPYMPKHQHGSAEVVVEELDDGEYELSPIELIMPGVWEIPVSVTPPESEPSEVTFRFCIAER
ncbi:MAG TPA: FixH family protein [Polyangiaceae bacterium]|nr:FixH family protein [Polyangiaceae bacterium]